MILRAPVVVTMTGPPIENGAVVIREGQIAEVGNWNEVRRLQSGQVRDLDGHALLPGLLNAHCHLDYTDLRGLLPRAGLFTDWIRAINQRKSSWTSEDILRSIRHGFAEAERFGTTTIVNFEAYPELIPELMPAFLRTWWMTEMIDVRQPVAPEEFLPRDSADALSHFGLAPHALFTASRELFRATAAASRRTGCLASTHLAESAEEMQMFRDGEGPLYDFMRAIGRPMDDCGKATPLGLFLGYEVLDERWIIAHLNELTESDRLHLESAPRFSIAHCPRSHAYFGHTEFPLQTLRELGFNICVGTDSLASNHDLSLLAELRQLSKTEPSLNAQSLLEMVTTNPARAIGAEESLGGIAAGFAADLIAIPMAENGGDIYEKIVRFEASVPWRMIGGCERRNA